MEKIKINNMSPVEIADKYFDSRYCRETYTPEELTFLKEGFIEGLKYIYPLYENQRRLINVYESLEKTD